MDELRKLDQQIAIQLGIDAIWCGDPDDGELMESECEEVVPHYSTDTNAALKLFDALPDKCTPRLVRMKWPQGHKWKAAIIVSDGLRFDHEIDNECDSAAEAICRVWLDYQNYHAR